MASLATCRYPLDSSTRDPSQNGGIQALIDLKAVHAVSDIWMNHYSGNAWARLELFLDSPFDADPVWSTSINNTQRNGIPVNEPTVCNGWVREMKVWLRWNTPPGSNY